MTSLKSLRPGVFGHDTFLLFAADPPFERHDTAAVLVTSEGDPEGDPEGEPMEVAPGIPARLD